VPDSQSNQEQSEAADEACYRAGEGTDRAEGEEQGELSEHYLRQNGYGEIRDMSYMHTTHIRLKLEGMHTYMHTTHITEAMSAGRNAYMHAVY
jgi:hypothetical protein